ncbi:MAG TPA: CARDB domain-containing protein, partial [Bryobacteraceae bacterium]
KVLVPGSKNPGQTDSMLEADIDVEWSGAIAPNATIIYVFSEDVFDSAFFAIDQSLAPVMTFSFGACEANVPASAVKIIAAEAQKAAALGITWVASSGDAGAAACENQNGQSTSATTRLSVNLPASLPEVTGIGGTELNEASGTFFAARRRDNLGTALSYVPERSWTDEAFIAANQFSGFAASGGGASAFFKKPSWQKGAGVPNDGARDVPDVSLTASPFHDPYALISSGGFVPTGGTSAAAPAFAAVVALLNQYLVSRKALAQPGLGNINPMLYSLAQTAPDAFHDVTSGSNLVPCDPGSTFDCLTGTMGFNAGPGYDQVTGLGSVDAFNLALDWQAQLAPKAHLKVTQFTAGTTVRAGGSLSISLTVANQGTRDAGAFSTRIYFTTNGDVSTALSFSIRCDEKGLAAGAASTCAGSITLGSGVVPGTYQLLAVADGVNSVPDLDPSGRSALASTGPLTVTQ